MLEFTYTNKVPPAARPGTNTNVVNLRWDGPNLIFGRRYVSRRSGKVDDVPIEHTFDNLGTNIITADNVAKQIHWGCCGWSAGGHEIWQLRQRIEQFLAVSRG